MCVAALGTDTGGGVRQPSAFNGVVGSKPTYGRVSRYGMVAFGSSYEQVGPITKNVADNAYLLEILSGVDQNDQTSLPETSIELSDLLQKRLIKEVFNKYPKIIEPETMHTAPIIFITRSSTFR